MIIDDHQVFAALLGEVLVDRGLELVGIHSTLADGMAAVGTVQPDLVVLDHRLPRDTGAGSVRHRAVSPSGRMVSAVMPTACHG